ncbi:MAG: hydroxymethylbilane synthase [Gammaproteobacteria bacterium]|nr:hydroxymethylbilane synthase [Gammaproteobacteria bacterium]
MTQRVIRIATRRSQLALWQANHVARLITDTFPELSTELVQLTTQGDKILDSPLAKIGGKGLFVKELETAMLNHGADIAVHSMKDVPVNFPAGLQLSSVLKREDPTDAFVSNSSDSLDQLPDNAVIGTSSLRRQSQLLARHAGYTIHSLRGNVNTRLSKLDDGQYDAIILASAGLKRLGLEHRITQQLSPQTSLPAIGQGAIGIESRVDDLELNQKLTQLADFETSICIEAERALNAGLNGGCQVPIGGFAEIIDGTLTLNGMVATPDGQQFIQSAMHGTPESATQLGQQMAEDLLARGADSILASLYE